MKLARIVGTAVLMVVQAFASVITDLSVYLLGKQIRQTISCANCHKANSTRLIVTNPALEK